MREEWYDMVDTVMKREEGICSIRKQRTRPFTAYVANEEQQCLDEITFDASQFSREHRADVSIKLLSHLYDLILQLNHIVRRCYSY